MQVIFRMSKKINAEIEQAMSTVAQTKKFFVVPGRYPEELQIRVKKLPLDELIIRLEAEVEMEPELVTLLLTSKQMKIGTRRYDIADQFLTLKTRIMVIQLEDGQNENGAGNLTMLSRLSNLVTNEGFYVSPIKVGNKLQYVELVAYLNTLRATVAAIERADNDWVESDDEDYEEFDETERESEVNLDPNGRPKRKLFRPTFAGKS